MTDEEHDDNSITIFFENEERDFCFRASGCMKGIRDESLIMTAFLICNEIREGISLSDRQP